MATEQEFYDEIYASLGGTLVDVELTESDIDICFRKAKRTMIQKGHQNYRHLYVEIDVTTDTRTYPVPDTVTDVVKVITPFGGAHTSSNDLFTISAFNDIFGGLGSSYGCDGFDFVTYELSLAQQDNIARYTASDVDFKFDPFRHTITFVGKPKQAGKYFVETYLDLNDDEYYDIDWIVRWTIAEAKIMLGTAYRKFSALASPQGDGNIGGSELISDGQREKEELLQEILDFTDGSADYMGIYVG